MLAVRIALGALASVSLTCVYTAVAEVGKGGHPLPTLLFLALPWPLAVLGWVRVVAGRGAGDPRVVVRVALALGLAQLATHAALDVWVPYDTRYVTPWWQLLALVPFAVAPRLARGTGPTGAARGLDGATRFAALLTTVALVGQLATIAWIRVAASDDETRRADVAIVLGFGLDERGRPREPLLARLRHGVELYRRGVVPRLLVTGGGVRGRTEADVMRLLALRAGVPDDAILVEPQARSTEENVLRSLELMRRHRLRTALLVSEPYHLPRAMMLARRHHLDARPSPSALGWPGAREQSFWVRREALHVMLLAVSP